MLTVLKCQLTYEGHVVTNAEARFNNSLRPRKPEGSLGRTAQDVHLDSHTAPELSQWHVTGSSSKRIALTIAVIGPENTLFTGASCIFLPGNFTGWGQ